MWFLTGFYGIPETNKKVESLHLLSKISNEVGRQWCVISDFNEITTQDKKFGERLWLQRQMEAFRLALECIGLIDLGWKN